MISTQQHENHIYSIARPNPRRLIFIITKWVSHSKGPTGCILYLYPCKTNETNNLPHSQVKFIFLGVVISCKKRSFREGDSIESIIIFGKVTRNFHIYSPRQKGTFMGKLSTQLHLARQKCFFQAELQQRSLVV